MNYNYNMNTQSTDNAPPQSIDEMPTSQMATFEGTTSIVVPSEVVERVTQLTLSKRISESYSPNYVQSVIEYLTKPVPITSGAFSTTDTNGTILSNVNTWAGVFSNTMWMNKLQGFYGLRSTLVVNLIINATPFQQGRWRLCYYPCENINPSKAAMHISHRVPLSQLPGVEIGAGDEMVTLKIPYTSPSRFIEMTSNIISWGRLYLVVMSQLRTGASGPSTADYTIWYSMEDVELFGQTNREIQPQSATGKLRSRKVSLPPSEEEVKPISHALGSAAVFAQSISKIPLLSPYSTPVSWFFNALKGAAISFGFSKPITTDKLCLMSANTNVYTTTSDGFDNSIPLSVLYDAKLRILDDVSHMGENEMSIDFIKSQWSYYESFTISTSNTRGQFLYREELIPRDTRIAISANEVYHTPISYLSNLFNLYRGGLEFMFKLVKTGFHAGSLAITYVPGPSDSTVSLVNSSFCYRTIVDLQSGDSMCFRVPYLLPLDYADTGIPFGSLYVNVVNPMRAPETCSSDVDVLVYVRGADSFQVQQPRSWASYTVTPQGGDLNEISKEITCEAPGNSPVYDLNLDFAQESASEYISSTLQLIKRYNPISIEYSNAATDNTINLSPFFSSGGRFASLVLSTPRFMNDWVYSQVLAPFAFFRGGIRIRVYNPFDSGDTSNYYMRRVDNNGGGGAPFVSTSLDTAPVSSVMTAISVPLPSQPIATNVGTIGGVCAQIPYQAPYRMCPVQVATSTNSNTNFYTPRPRVVINFPANKNRAISRSVGEDFQALFWVGIPRMNN